MGNFKISLKNTLEKEGLFSNIKGDKGGATKFGIIESVARSHGYSGLMQDLTIEQAESIYFQDYWTPLKLDMFDQLISDEMFDTAVNQGTGTAAKYLQTSLNRLNNNQKLYKDIVVDGAISQTGETVQAYNSYMKSHEKYGKTAVTVLLKALTICQGERYNLIVDKDNTQEMFYFGWLSHRI